MRLLNGKSVCFLMDRMEYEMEKESFCADLAQLARCAKCLTSIKTFLVRTKRKALFFIAVIIPMG